MRKIFCLFLSVLLVSCFSSIERDMLSRLERLLESSPDSALVVFRNNFQDAESFSRDGRMKYLLLGAESMNKCFVAMDTVTFMPDVLEYFEAQGAAPQLVEANYMMGCVYRDRGDGRLALKYYNRAVGVADSVDLHIEPQLLASIYAQMGLVFHERRISSRALDAWHNAQRYALLAHDTLWAMQCYEHAGYEYYAMGNVDSALSVAKSVYASYKRMGKYDYASASLGTLILDRLQHGCLAEAKRYLDEYVAHSGMFDSNGNLKKGHEVFYYYLGDYYERSGHADSALFYYRRMLADASRLNSRENGSRGLMRVYAKLGEADSVAKYANMFADANDSASYRQSEADISRLQAVYDYSESQKRAAAEAERAGRYRLMAMFLVVALLVVAFLVYVYIIRYRRRKALALQRINADYTDALSRYDAAVRDRDMLRLGLEECRKKKDEEISMLREGLASFCTDDEDGEALPSVQSLDSHPTIIHAHRRIAKGEMLSVGEMNCIVALVRDALPGFYEALENSGDELSEKEKILCVFTRLRFLPSEIATALGITVQGISNMRSRLNSRMFHKKGTRSFTANIYRM